MARYRPPMRRLCQRRHDDDGQSLPREATMISLLPAALRQRPRPKRMIARPFDESSALAAFAAGGADICTAQRPLAFITGARRRGAADETGAISPRLFPKR